MSQINLPSFARIYYPVLLGPRRPIPVPPQCLRIRKARAHSCARIASKPHPRLRPAPTPSRTNHNQHQQTNTKYPHQHTPSFDRIFPETLFQHSLPRRLLPHFISSMTILSFRPSEASGEIYQNSYNLFVSYSRHLRNVVLRTTHTRNPTANLPLTQSPPHALCLVCPLVPRALCATGILPVFLPLSLRPRT